MRIIVNGQEMECSAHRSLLEALAAAGIRLPTLCAHPALGGDGRCGLCIVEISNHSGWQPVLACQVKPSPELQVRTETERIQRLRRMSARLLLRHAPFVDPAALAFLCQIGATEQPEPATETPVDRTVEPAIDGSGCILCGLCVRACAKTGRGYLLFAGKGQEMKVRAWPGPSECSNCSACITVCPTGFMNVETKTKILVKW